MAESLLTKKKGGLGVVDLRRMNISMLCKWWWKLKREEGLWQMIVRQKYMKKKCVAHLHAKNSNSPMWNDIIKVRDIYVKNRVMVIGDRERTDFWSDACCGITPLKDIFPDLFAICNEQKSKVTYVARRGWRLTFQTWLDEHC